MQAKSIAKQVREALTIIADDNKATVVKLKPTLNKEDRTLDFTVSFADKATDTETDNPQAIKKQSKVTTDAQDEDTPKRKRRSKEEMAADKLAKGKPATETKSEPIEAELVTTGMTLMVLTEVEGCDKPQYLGAKVYGLGKNQIGVTYRSGVKAKLFRKKDADKIIGVCDAKFCNEKAYTLKYANRICKPVQLEEPI